MTVKGFIKLSKEYRKFYLPVLVIIVLLMLFDTAWIISDNNLSYKGSVWNYRMEQDSQDTFLEKNIRYLERGKDYEAAIAEKMDWNVFGFVPTLFILVLVTLLKRAIFEDRSFMEHQMLLPVKQLTKVLHDYVSAIALLLVITIGQGGILLAVQSAYNRQLIEAAKSFSVENISESIVAAANDRLMLQIGFYSFYLLLWFTWIFLGMTVTRNPIVGIAVSWLTWYSVSEFLYPMQSLFDKTENDYNRCAYFLDRLSDSLSPYEWYWKYEYHQNDFAQWRDTALIMGGLFIIFLVLILLFGKNIELSRGKLFYFPFLDYPFSIMCGYFFIIVLEEWLGLYIEPWMLLAGYILAVLICLWIHPISNDKQIRLEVK